MVNYYKNILLSRIIKIKYLTATLIILSTCKSDDYFPVVYYFSDRNHPVAKVNDHVIDKFQLSEAIRESNLKPGEALEKIIDEYLIIHTALEMGFNKNERVIREWKRALVQKLLEEEIEKKANPENIEFNEIKKYYVNNYANRGKLLEEAVEEIKYQITLERRKKIYENMIKDLERKYKPVIKKEKFDFLNLDTDN